MIRRDMQDIHRIENALFCDQAWTEEDFVRCLRQRNCIGMTAENYEGDIVGYMIYELHRTRLHLLNFAVDPGYHRKGIGRQMIGKLVAKLSHQRRTKIVTEVRESNLSALYFFKSMGFLAVGLLKDYYQEPGHECDDDAILLEYYC